MRLRVLAIGTRMPVWVTKAWGEYAKRLPAEIRVELVELPLAARNRNAGVERTVALEGAAMLRRIEEADTVIALDLAGKPWSTVQLAGRLRDWQLDGGNYCLLIGGPDGLAPACLERAAQKWSLSPLTLPHPLVRVILIEQLYRAWSINAGHPYHR